MSFLTSVFLLTTSFLLYVYWRFHKSREFFKRNAIPYSKPTIFVGNIGDALFKQKAIPILHLEMYKKLEPQKFGGFFYFHSPIVMVCDPELIKHIMIKDFAHFSDRGMNVNVQLDRLSNHLLSMKGDEWKNLKAKLTSNFTGAKMKSMFPLIKKSSEKLVQVLDTMTEKPFDVKDLCARFMTDVVGTCAFGIDIQSLDNPDSQFRKMGDRIFEFRYKELIMSAYPNLPPYVKKIFNLRFVREEVDKFLTSAIENTVKHREENDITRNDFIDSLLSIKNESIGKYQENQDLDHSFLEIVGKKFKNKIGMTTDKIEDQDLDHSFLEIACKKFKNKIGTTADKIEAQDLDHSFLEIAGKKFKNKIGMTTDKIEDQDLDHSFLEIACKNLKNKIGITADKIEDQDLDHSFLEIADKKLKNKIDMTVDKMAAQCYIFFRAGFESTSTVLGLLMLELAIHQDIQNKLRLEINAVINNNPEGLTYEMLKEMTYLDMVLCEILRKYPVSGYAVRKCTMDYKIPNTEKAMIPEKTQVIIPILGLHRDTKYYEKPDDFYPEHFTEEAKANRPNHAYLPFGSGPRACLGERFAKMQMKIGLISLLRDFTFKLSPKTVLPVQFQRHFKILKSKGGIWLQCKKI